MCSKGIKVKLLFAPGCESTGPALRVLRRVLAEEGCRSGVLVRQILNDDDAVRSGFRGSPTILIDGVDIEGPAASRDGHRLRCRVYFPHGECPGVPDASLIRKALHTHPGLRRPVRIGVEHGR